MSKAINYFGKVTIRYVGEETINIILKTRGSTVVLLNTVVTLKAGTNLELEQKALEHSKGLSYSDALLMHKIFSAIGLLINNNKVANTPEYQFHSIELIHDANSKYVNNLKNLLISFTFMDNILSRNDSFALNFNVPIEKLEEMFGKDDKLYIGVDDIKEESDTLYHTEYPGIVLSVDNENGNAEITGLSNQEIGELVEFDNGVQGMIFNVCDTYGNIKVIIFQKDINITKASRCKNLNRKLELPNIEGVNRNVQ